MANLTVSSAFPSDFHNAVAQAADRWLRAQSEAERNTPPGPRLEFCGGWGAVEIRYQACCEHEQGFSDAIKRGSSHTDLCVQERELFGFFTTGLAALESFFMHYTHSAGCSIVVE